MSDMKAKALARYYPCDIQDAVVIIYERLMEWDYETDAHGWCHDRAPQLAMLDEIMKHRPDLVDHIRSKAAYKGWPES